MVDRIYRIELQLNKANSSDTEAPFWIWRRGSGLRLNDGLFVKL